MDKINSVETVKKLGFTEYEAKCYLALFEKESLSVSEIVAIAGVPQANVYGTMEKLLVKGMCTLLPGRMKRFAAVDPTAFREKSLESINDTVNSLNSLSDELDTLFKTSRSKKNSLDYIEVLKNDIRVGKRFEQLVKESKEEILSLTTQKAGRYLQRKSMVEDQVEFGMKTIAKGIDIKCIYEIPANEEERKFLFNNVIEKYAQAGEQIKIIKTLPMRMAIFDEKVVMFSLADPVLRNPESTSQIVRHPVMAKSMKMIFETLWNQAEDYNEYKKRMKFE